MSKLDTSVLLIYTGGTIGMQQDPETGALKPFDFHSLLKQIPELELIDCNIDSFSFDEPIDSSSMTPGDWIVLGKVIEKNYHDYDGFVILHGTDTMAFTASALSFLLENLNKAVILTGSQLPIGILRSDARENLINSIEIAAAKDAKGDNLLHEVAVYFEYKLYRGNRVFKNSSQDFNAFQSLNYPHLAVAGVSLKYNKHALYPKQSGMFYAHSNMENCVNVIRLFPGMSETVFKAMMTTPAKGIILHTFGAGNTPKESWFYKLIESAINRGVFVANITQCRGGGVTSGLYAAGIKLQKLGVLSGGDMTIEAGLTKMMFLLSRDLSPKAFKNLYIKSLKGELTEAS